MEEVAGALLVKRASIADVGPTTRVRGLVAECEIAAGETVASIRLRDCLTSACDAAVRWAGTDARVTWQAAMACALLEQRACGSAYAASIPWDDDCKNMPLCFGWDEMQRVHTAPPALAELYAARAIVGDAWDALGPEMVAKGLAESEEDMVAAVAAVHSRTFMLDQGGTRALVPFLDLCNHDNEAANVDWRCVDIDDDGGDEIGKVVALVALRDIVQGEEILTSYGGGPSDARFVHNGFVPPRNREDAAALFESAEAAMEWLLHALPRCEGTTARAYEAYGTLDGDVGKGANAVTSSLGVGIGGEFSEFLIAAFETTVSGTDAPQVSRSLLRRRCAELLESFPTTLAQDMLALGFNGDPRRVNEATPFTESTLPPLASGCGANADNAHPISNVIGGERHALAVRLNASKKLALCAGLVESWTSA